MVEPALRERGVVVAEQHYDAGEVFEVGHMVRFGSANAISQRPVPVTGRHSVEILRELGRSEAEIERLITGEVVRAAGRSVAMEAAGKHA
jgi:crotonobetainyl-CoA:carnitine CoA-transferase CaiB-like acyl-CoA transferase